MCTPRTVAISSARRPSNLSRACPGAGRGSPALGPLHHAAPISTGRAMRPVPQHQPSASIFPACLPPQPSSQANNPFHRPFAGGLPRKWSVERVRSCGFGLGFEGDLIAEAFEAALEIGNGATLTDLVEIRLSEIVINQAPGEHVIGGHDNLMSNGQG